MSFKINFSKILKFIYWSSPILKLISNTADAVSDGYDERHITDPGHIRVRLYDKVVITFSWIVAMAIIIPSGIHYLELYSNNYVYFTAVMFFPYITSVWITSLLYANSIILSIYNNNRKNIIRRINEKKGTW